MKPCKHLDYTEGKYLDCEIKTCEPHFPEVRYWKRGATWTNDDERPRDVQFCNLRGRINGIFDCYNESEMSCHEPEDSKQEKEAAK